MAGEHEALGLSDDEVSVLLSERPVGYCAMILGRDAAWVIRQRRNLLEAKTEDHSDMIPGHQLDWP